MTSRSDRGAGSAAIRQPLAEAASRAGDIQSPAGRYIAVGLDLGGTAALSPIRHSTEPAVTVGLRCGARYASSARHQTNKQK
jgi:hypothetical protein